LKKMKERDRSWLKGILEQETTRFNSRDNIATPHKVPRLVVKYIKDTTRVWPYGYDQKAPYHCHSMCNDSPAWSLLPCTGPEETALS